MPTDDHLAPTGRVMEMLSEHQCEGWLEGYLLTGRHGLFNSYEAFIHIIDSMFNQHAKWLKVTRHIPWRRPIASLNILLASHVWRQDHNGFTHQDPGFIDHVVNKKAEVIRVYLPPDANMPALGDGPLPAQPALRQRDRGRQAPVAAVARRWTQAVKHCTAGIGIWEWASNDRGSEPDVVMACAGDVPTLETLAAVQLLREHVPELKIRVVNVVDLMRLQPATEHPHGLERPRLRHALHQGQAGHLRLPRLSLADPPPDLPADQPPATCTCAATRRRGRSRTPFDMAVHERPRPVPPGRRTWSTACRSSAARPPTSSRRARQADRAPAVHHQVRRGHARDPRLEVEAVGGRLRIRFEEAGRRLVGRAKSSECQGDPSVTTLPTTQTVSADRPKPGNRCRGPTIMSATLPEVYLARHGETAWTISHQHTGRSDIPLTERGERQRLAAWASGCGA